MSASLLLSLIGVALAGAVSHELAHWIVWKASGRDPELDLWQLEVRPRAGPPNVVGADRVAAAAPYVAGAFAIAAGSFADLLLVMVFGIAMIQIPSAVDLATMRGDVVWQGRKHSTED